MKSGNFRHDMLQPLRGRTSMLKKAQRMAAIEEGTRPLHVQLTKGDMKLHPTKGWRRS